VIILKISLLGCLKHFMIRRRHYPSVTTLPNLTVFHPKTILLLLSLTQIIFFLSRDINFSVNLLAYFCPFCIFHLIVKRGMLHPSEAPLPMRYTIQAYTFTALCFDKQFTQAPNKTDGNKYF
jgi:hypothetical protein